MKRSAGYIAINRSIFDHPALRKPERFLAWQWLIAQAAWKPEGSRGPWGVVHVERGEIATSTRLLAQSWRWPQSNVRCFLARLVRDGMVVVTKTRSATRSPTGPQLPQSISVISICNYDKFQDASTRSKSKPAQQPAQQPAQATLQGIVETGSISLLTTKPPNQRIDRSDEVLGKGKAASKPATIKRSEKNNTIFIPIDHPQYPEFVADFREATGSAPLPHDGGNWFYIIGEAERPAHLMHLRPKPAEKAA